MNNKAKLLGVLLFSFLLNTQTAISQDIAMNTNTELNNKNLHSIYLNTKSKVKEEVTIKNKVLDEGKYFYQNGNKEVLVVIEDGFYTEYHENNEFIKAKIEWSSKNEYKLVITEIKKKNIPFGVGTKMDTKIVRVKGSRFYYESNLQGLTWSGKFMKVESDF